MTDERLKELLRAAIPHATDEGAGPDAWTRMSARFDEPPRWSYVDLGLAAAVVAAMAIFPEWRWPLAYHL